MSKIRIYELARNLGIQSKELVSLLQKELEMDIKNHMSVVKEEEAEFIKELFEENKKNENKKSNVKPQSQDKSQDEVENKDNKSKNKENVEENTTEEESNKVIEIGETITVKELSEKLDKPSTEVIKTLIFMGVMASINQEINYETAKKLSEKFDITAVLKENDSAGKIKEDLNIELGKDAIKRPPVVTIMGHVDHGKTSLLDAIKKSKVTETEAGGITQHIGAYTVDINEEKITFLDTPGHEAFTAMRARGAQVTDIVILVVAADDSIMPQTEEAINHCKAANVPIIVAINKIDKPSANVDKVKQDLTEYELIPEDWGGDVVCVPVSARTKKGIDELLEMVLLVSEMEELKANPDGKAKGTVIEAKLDKGRGTVASLLIQSGTLNVGDSIIAGPTYGRIRAMFNDKGANIKTAGPSIPVEILGLSNVPDAGDRFHVVKDEKTAREIAEKRSEEIRVKNLQSNNKVSLEDLYSQIKEGKVKELSLIIKADVQGSVEAIKKSLEDLSTDTIKIRVIHTGVGAITETDIILASASNAVVIGFNVRPKNDAIALAEKESVDIKTYRIIYDAIDDIKLAMIGMLDPEYKEVIIGRAEVREIYKVSSIGTIAGCYVLSGKIIRNCGVRIIRDGVVIIESELASLKRFKDDAKEVASGYECGLSIENFNDIKKGDIIETFEMREVKKKEL